MAATALAALAVAAQQPAASAAETDYSNNPSAPSSVTADSLGRYIFEGRVAGNYTNTPGGPTSSEKCLSETDPTINCADYITINIPSGFVISRINLDYYNSADDRAFIGFQSGSQFITATGFVGTNLLAYNHFGWRGLCATSYGTNPTTPNANYNCFNGLTNVQVTSLTATDLLTNVYTATPPFTHSWHPRLRRLHLLDPANLRRFQL